jgi:hypothetical protein
MSVRHTVNPSLVRFGRLMMIGGTGGSYDGTVSNYAEREVLSTIYSADSCNAKHDAPRTI